MALRVLLLQPSDHHLHEPRDRLQGGPDLGIPARVGLTPALRPAAAGAHSLPTSEDLPSGTPGSASLPEMAGAPYERPLGGVSGPGGPVPPNRPAGLDAC